MGIVKAWVMMAHFMVFCYIRFKYADPGNEDAGISIADMPARPIDKGIAGPGLFACRILIDVNPFDYLRDVNGRLPEHSIQRLDELLPGKWEPLKR